MTGLLRENGYELRFDETVTGNRSPIDTPLMDAIRGFLESEDPGATVAPVVLPGFSDSRWFRAARSPTAWPTASSRRTRWTCSRPPIVHGADERVPVGDLGLAARGYSYLELGAAGVDVPEDKLRLGGMALRQGLLVHGPTHWAAAVPRTGEGELKVASDRKPDFGGSASERLPGLRGVVKLAEAIAVIPLVKRAA